MSPRGARFMCWLIGHKPKPGPLKRSPYTVYTHWREVKCQRCGEEVGRVEEYRDTRAEPELFRPV